MEDFLYTKVSFSVTCERKTERNSLVADWKGQGGKPDPFHGGIDCRTTKTNKHWFPFKSFRQIGFRVREVCATVSGFFQTPNSIQLSAAKIRGENQSTEIEEFESFFFILIDFLLNWRFFRFSFWLYSHRFEIFFIFGKTLVRK